MVDQRLEGSRNQWDFFHFAIAFGGFCLALGGVVLSSICIAISGLIIFAWGMAYFVAHNDED